MEHEKPDDQTQGAEKLLACIDATLLGLAQLRAQTGIYEYIPAARLATRLSGIILSPTLLPAPTIRPTAETAEAMINLLDNLQRMGAAPDHY
ncbi:hypothetical protein [Gluconobacter oxydans]|uniref:hypothetical protein n=1 Tax=Gluconobacter TaxID=441 RepID=UPI00062C27F4|nr:hypothetical protein [Gluconobacter oxydans]